MLDVFFAQLIKRYGHFLGLGVEIALSLRHVEKTLIFSGGLYSHFQYEDLSYDLLKFYPLVTRPVHSCAISFQLEHTVLPLFHPFELITLSFCLTRYSFTPQVKSREACLVLPDTHLHLKLGNGKHALSYQILIYTSSWVTGSMHCTTRYSFTPQVESREACLVLPDTHLPSS